MEATRMKALGLISTTALFLLFGATVPAFAQEDHHDEGAKPAQHEEQAKPAAKQEQAKPQKQEEQAKPAKQEQAKPEKQQQEAKPQKKEQQAKSQEQNQQQQAKGQQQQQENQHEQQVKTQQNEEKSQQHQQQQANGQAQQSQGKYARNGQKDREGHEYSESRFGPNHHSRFEKNGGRYYNGRREYSYGGYWFYAGAYPAWFYQRDVYFILGTDGLWYAVAYDDPSLTFQVNIG
jgi:outer membrane biosynthesis protein TonB